MKPEYEIMSSEGMSRRRILKMAGVGVVAGVVGTSSIAGAGAVRDNMKNYDGPKEIDILIHFADADYSESVMNNADVFKGLNAELLMRSYVYVDYTNRACRTFRKVHPHKEMSKVLGNSRVVASTCYFSLIEAQKRGAVPIYLNDGNASKQTIASLEAHHINVVDLTNRAVVAKSLNHALRAKNTLAHA